MPDSWVVRLRTAGGDATEVPPGQLAGADTGMEDSAVLTALPVLEDAALVVLATDTQVKPDYFAKQVEEFIPLTNIEFTQKSEPYALGGLHGLAGEGHGTLEGEGTEVYFRTLVAEVGGRTVFVTLYAQQEHRKRYEGTFDRILSSMREIQVSSPGLPKAPKAPAAPVVDVGSDIRTTSSPDVPTLREDLPMVSDAPQSDAAPASLDVPASPDLPARPDTPPDLSSTPDVRPAVPDKDVGRDAPDPSKVQPDTSPDGVDVPRPGAPPAP